MLDIHCHILRRSDPAASIGADRGEGEGVGGQEEGNGPWLSPVVRLLTRQPGHHFSATSIWTRVHAETTMVAWIVGSTAAASLWLHDASAVVDDNAPGSAH